MTKEEIMVLVEAALDVQMASNGENGRPYVSVAISNYSPRINISMRDDGFDSYRPYDGNYEFHLTKPCSERWYNQCLSHLRELKEKCARGKRG